MSTKSTRSSGTQITHRGVNQGNVLVDPITGLPIDVTVDGGGVRRLAVDADITVDSITVDTRDLTPQTDGVRIEDPSNDNVLGINNDGSINVNVVSGSTSTTEINLFNSISSVSSGSNTLLQSYTVPVGKTDSLQIIEVSGTNIAQYEVYKNASVIARKYTFFGNSLNEVFAFNNLKLIAGDNIQVKVFHNRSSLGDFNSRIQISEV